MAVLKHGREMTALFIARFFTMSLCVQAGLTVAAVLDGILVDRSSMSSVQ